MLIVMEDRNGHKLFESLLDVKAVRCLQVLKVDATIGRGQKLDTVDEIVWVLSIHADINRFDTSELVEEDCFALHDRLGGQCAQVAKAKDSRAIGDDSDGVALVRILVGVLWVFSDLDARDGHAR